MSTSAGPIVAGDDADGITAAFPAGQAPDPPRAIAGTDVIGRPRLAPTRR